MALFEVQINRTVTYIVEACNKDDVQEFLDSGQLTYKLSTAYPMTDDTGWVSGNPKMLEISSKKENPANILLNDENYIEALDDDYWEMNREYHEDKLVGKTWYTFPTDREMM